MKTSLRQRILSYYQRNTGVWIASGEIQRLVTNNTKFSPSNATRRLRELQNDGLLEVKYEKGHALYRYIPHSKRVQEYVVQGDKVIVVNKVVID